MRFSCPSCNKMYRLPPERMAGYQRAQIACPNCKANIIVRNLGGDVLDARLATREVSGPVLLTDVRAISQMTAPVESNWFVAIGRDRQGPMTPMRLSELLAVGTITGQSLVWQKGMANWVPMSEVPDLRGLLRPPSGMNAAAPPPAMPRPSQTAIPAVQAPAPQPAPAPVQTPAPAPVQPAVRTLAPLNHGGSGEAGTPGARPPSQPTAPAPVSPRPPSQPTAPAPVAARPPSQPTAPAPVSPRKAADSDINRVQTETHSESFFTSHHDLDHISLAMPEADKHKPTKEEYQNLLQEFSVMFRLDKRSKRQKVLITVVISALVLGAIGFGLVINYQGKKKQQLLTDANNILGMFSLQYQNSQTIDLQGDQPQAPVVAGQAPKPAAPKQEVQLSDLAVKMRAVVKAKAAKKPQVVATGGPQVSKEEQERLMKLLDAGGAGGGPKQVAVGAEDVTSAQIKKMCGGKDPSFRGCAQSSGTADFKVKFTVNTGGRVEDVKAIAGGKEESGLSACCERNMKSVNFGPQSKESQHTCTID